MVTPDVSVMPLDETPQDGNDATLVNDLREELRCEKDKNIELIGRL